MEEILELFRDERWHGLDEIADKFNITRALARDILGFLGRFGFFKLDKSGEKAIISPLLSTHLRWQEKTEEMPVP